MSTQIYNSFKDCAKLSQETILAVNSLIEYNKSLKTKLAAFVSRDQTRSDDEYVSLALIDKNTNEQVIAPITKSIYENVMNDDDGTISIPVNSAGYEILVDKSDVVEGFEELLQETTLQTEYLEYCVTATEVKAADFCSIIKSKYECFSGVMLEKYTELLTADSASSLRNFSSLFSTRSIQRRDSDTDDERIVLVDASSYVSGPNVWVDALTDIGNTILSFFEGVFDKWYKVGEMFEKLGKATIKLIKWLATKISANLLTVYEKGDKKYGILDFPIVQLPLFRVYKDVRNMYQVFPTNNIAGIAHYILDYLTPLADNNAAFCFGTDGVNAAKSVVIESVPGGEYQSIYFGDHSGLYDRFYSCLCVILESMRNTDENGVEFLMPYDVIVPTSEADSWPYNSIQTLDLVIRFGLSSIGSADWVSMQVFVADTFDNWNALTDKQNYERIYETIGAFGHLTHNLFPTCYYKFFLLGSADEAWSDNNKFITRLDHFFDYPDVSMSDNNLSPADHCHLVVNTDLSTWRDDYISSCSTMDFSTFDDCQEVLFDMEFILTLLSYGASFGPVPKDVIISWKNIGDNHTRMCHTQWAVGNVIAPYTNYPITISGWGGDEDYVNTQFETTDWCNFYKPYVKYALTPVAVHLQDYSEQVKEAKTFMIRVFIAIAAVVITVKLLKWRSKRIKQGAILQADADRLSWEVFDPSKETTMDDWLKARGKAKRYNRVNSLLGMSSSLAMHEATSSVSDGIMSAIRGVTGQTETTPDDKTSLTTITKLIRGS